jgi:hypothetical protein
MNLLNPFKWFGTEAKAVLAELVPPDMQTELGAFAHTLVANVLHDAGAEAKTLTQPLLAKLWSDIKTAGISLAAQYASGASFTALIATGVRELKGEATILAPELKVIGEETLTTMLRTATQTALAAAATNPSPASASASASASATS